MNNKIFVFVLLLTGCHSFNRLIGVKKQDVPRASYIVSCCQDNVNGVLSYPSFVPDSHVQLCQAASQACHNNDCHIGNDMYLPMHVDCGHGFGFIGDQYYVGKGY